MAIESLHNLFVHSLTKEEKEHEKQWMANHLRFTRLYDGAIVVLYRHLGLNSDAYYTHKGTFGFNVQVCIHLYSV